MNEIGIIYAILILHILFYLLKTVASSRTPAQINCSLIAPRIMVQINKISSLDNNFKGVTICMAHVGCLGLIAPQVQKIIFLNSVQDFRSIHLDFSFLQQQRKTTKD